MDNKLETLNKIAKIRKETKKLREDIKRLQEKVVQIKAKPWLLTNKVPVNKICSLDQRSLILMDKVTEFKS